MAFHIPLILLLTFSLLAAPPISPPPPQMQSQQVSNIIDALIGAGDYSNWANILSGTDPTSLPLTFTLFIPTDDALSHLPTTPPLSFDPFLFFYHIVPQRLSFSRLQLFPTKTRLPTLLASKSILITNNSFSNFTLDNSKITTPDLFLSGDVSVQGIDGILDYSVFGGDGNLNSPPPPPSKGLVSSSSSPPPPLPPKKRPKEYVGPNGECLGGRRSNAAGLFIGFFPICLLNAGLIDALGFKIL